MGYIYIATVVAMLCLIVFSTLAIITISKTTNRNIQKKTLELVSMYDYLLESHSQELKNTKKLIDQLGMDIPATEQVLQKNDSETVAVSKGISAMNTVENIGKAAYLNPHMADVYQTIRQEFTTDIEEVLQGIPDVTKTFEKGPATKLLETLPYETLYAMSFLQEDEQLSCMRESLEDAEQIAILGQYLNGTQKFLSIDFYTYLKELAEYENREATIYVSPNVVVNNPQSLNVVVSDDICEGIQVEINHVLYDYAIQKKEIG